MSLASSCKLEQCIPGGGTPHILFEQGANRGVGTPHMLSEQGANKGAGDTAHQNRLPVVIEKDGLRVGGWLGGWFHENNATLWLHLASWNLLDFQLC